MESRPKEVHTTQIKCKGFKPYSYQKEVCYTLHKRRGTGWVCTVKSRRQTGKSIMIENMLLDYSLNYNNKTSICLSPTLNQSRKVFKDLVAVLSPTGIMKTNNAQTLEIGLINGSQILFKSAEQRDSLRGYTVSGILCIDEAAFIPDEIFYIVLPWCDVNKAPILITSTPLFKSGFFYNYYCLGLDGKEGYYSFDWSSDKYKEDMDKVLSPEKLEEYRKIMPKAQFKSEYLGEFLDDDSTLFEGFKGCIGEADVKLSQHFYVGIDWGSGKEGDRTVVSVVDNRGKQVYLDFFDDLNTTQQIDRIAGICERFGKNRVSVEPEQNGIGAPMCDLLEQRLQGWNIERFTTTNDSKNDIVKQLQVAFEQKALTILDNETQTRELSMYSMEFNPKTKTVTYNAPRGTHDDTVCALMFAWDAYKKGSTVGQYCIRINRNR